MEDSKRQNARTPPVLQAVGRHKYIVVYANGMNEPIEISVLADRKLAVDDPEDKETVEQFIQSSLDMDCRRLLFMYYDPVKV